jgi:glutamate/tyrosine decarboxylase-like PLP-dependent enzyme
MCWRLIHKHTHKHTHTHTNTHTHTHTHTHKQAQENLGAMGWRLSLGEIEALDAAAAKVPRELVQVCTSSTSRGGGGGGRSSSGSSSSGRSKEKVEASVVAAAKVPHELARTCVLCLDDMHVRLTCTAHIYSIHTPVPREQVCSK